MVLERLLVNQRRFTDLFQVPVKIEKIFFSSRTFVLFWVKLFDKNKKSDKTVVCLSTSRTNYPFDRTYNFCVLTDMILRALFYRTRAFQISKTKSPPARTSQFISRTIIDRGWPKRHGFRRERDQYRHYPNRKGKIISLTLTVDAAATFECCARRTRKGHVFGEYCVYQRICI